MRVLSVYFFFFNDTATTEIYTLSLHDALPIFRYAAKSSSVPRRSAALSSQSIRSAWRPWRAAQKLRATDRKSTRLNSSHLVISYAVFCLKKKKGQIRHSDAHLRYADSTTTRAS